MDIQIDGLSNTSNRMINECSFGKMNMEYVIQEEMERDAALEHEQEKKRKRKKERKLRKRER